MPFAGYSLNVGALRPMCELMVSFNTTFSEDELQQLLRLLEQSCDSNDYRFLAQKICSLVSDLHKNFRWIVACGSNVLATDVHPKHVDVSLFGVLKPRSLGVLIVRGARCDGSVAPIYGCLSLGEQSGRFDSTNMLPERFAAIVRSMILSTQSTSAAVATEIHDYIRSVVPQQKFVVVAGRMFTCDPHKDSVVFWARSADIWIIIFRLEAPRPASPTDLVSNQI